MRFNVRRIANLLRFSKTEWLFVKKEHKHTWAWIAFPTFARYVCLTCGEKGARTR